MKKRRLKRACINISLSLLLLLPHLALNSYAQAPDVNFTLSESYLPIGGFHTLQITGAAPNSPVLISEWVNGQAVAIDANFGYFTDANGNWSFTRGPYTQSYEGVRALGVKVAGRNAFAYFVVGRSPESLPPPPQGTSFIISQLLTEPGTGRQYIDAALAGAQLSMSTRVFFSGNSVSNIGIDESVLLGTSFIPVYCGNTSQPPGQSPEPGWSHVLNPDSWIDQDPCYSCITKAQLRCTRGSYIDIAIGAVATVSVYATCAIGVAGLTTITFGAAAALIALCGALGLATGAGIATKGKNDLDKCMCDVYSSCQGITGQNCNHVPRTPNCTG